MIDNGVQEFDLIVFKHQGNMLFDFLVFDQSTCERQYPNLLDEIDVEDHIHGNMYIYKCFLMILLIHVAYLARF